MIISIESAWDMQMRQEKIMREKRKRNGLLALIFLCALLMAVVPVNAGAKYQNQWVKNAKGEDTYYNAKGKKLTGMQKIGKRYFYFDSKGIQRTGWRKIKGDYYFFRLDTQAKGYRIGSKTINGIKLAAGGKAVMNSYSKRKLPLLVKANETLQSITNAKMTKTQKLRKAFDYTKSHLKSYNRGGFQNSSTWDIFYAEIAFSSGRADCYSYAAYFAYLANALGYKATAISSGGHGWTEIDGKIYDTNWAKASSVDSYFAMSYDLSGVAGRPRYKTNKLYLKRV